MAVTIPSELTSMQEQILSAIQNYWDAHGRPPKIRELERSLGVHYFTIKSQLWTLRAKGLVNFTDGRLRSVRLLKPQLAS